MTKRIEYIDAMRGFTMILVVLAHVISFSYQGIDVFNWGGCFKIFRMPLFFFISGFIMFKASRVWSGKVTWDFLKKKFKVQIIPTIFFLSTFAYLYHLDFYDSLIHKAKGGYWFTLTLFVYFFIFSTISMLCSKLCGQCWERKSYITMLVLSIGLIFFDSKFVDAFAEKHHIAIICNIAQWRYFIFFFIGVLARRYFDKITKLLDNSRFLTIVIGAFILSLLLWYGEDCNMWWGKLEFFAWGLLGIIVVFSFFRKYEASFVKETILGSCLQYIGRRTLDIYLIHYFLLPRNLQALGHYFSENSNPTIELFITLIISLIVIGLCLLVSNVIRLSPTLAYWLFGQKKVIKCE